MLIGTRCTLAISTILITVLSAAAPAAAAQPRSSPVILAVFTDPVEDNLFPRGSGTEPGDRLLRSLIESRLAVGLVSTSQGNYGRDQTLLDVTQGSRQPRAVYRADLPAINLTESDEGWRVEDWIRIGDRAQSASATLRPGLLASSVPGGAAYVVAAERPSSIGVLAAGLDGRVARVSLGDTESLSARAASVLEEGAGMAVIELPSGQPGRAALRQILVGHPETLLMAIHLPPTRTDNATTAPPGDRFYSQTAFAITGDRVAGTNSIRSATTRQPGLIAAVDIAPTALQHLGVPAPLSMRGQVVEGAELDPTELEQRRHRWSDIRSGRQSSSVRNILLMSLGLWAATAIVVGVRRATPPSLRILGLAMMWFPATALLLAPPALVSGTFEAFLIGSCAVGLAALVDRLLRWPRAPLLPAAASLAVLVIDLARGGPLLTSSVIGPSVSSGNRFYGLSNEIEPLIPALVLFAVAGAGWLLAGRTRRLVVVYAVLGALTAFVVGAGRLGADVGGVVTVAGAFTVAGFVVTGRKADWRLAVVVAGIAALGIAALIAIDLALGSQSHLANNLSRLSSPGEFVELFARRYRLAGQVALQPANLISVVVTVGAVLLVVRNREIFLPSMPSRLWLAALLGTLAGGLAGALSNDSGPVLLVNGIIAAAAGVSYLAGIPLVERQMAKPANESTA